MTAREKDLIDKILGLGVTPKAKDMFGVIPQNDINFIKFLIKKGFPIDETVVRRAAAKGALTVVQYCHDKLGLPISEKTVLAAAYGSRYAKRTFSYFRSIGVSFRHSALWDVLLRVPYNPPLLRLLVEIGFNPEAEMAVAAVNMQRLDYLKWLRKNHCPFQFDELLMVADPRKVLPPRQVFDRNHGQALGIGFLLFSVSLNSFFLLNVVMVFLT